MLQQEPLLPRLLSKNKIRAIVSILLMRILVEQLRQHDPQQTVQE